MHTLLADHHEAANGPSQRQTGTFERRREPMTPAKWRIRNCKKLWLRYFDVLEARDTAQASMALWEKLADEQGVEVEDIADDDEVDAATNQVEWADGLLESLDMQLTDIEAEIANDDSLEDENSDARE